MMIFIPSAKSVKFSELSDPFVVLKESGLTLNDLTLISHKTEIPIQEDGWLAFIVNEAVISGHPLASDTSKKYYSAIQRSAQELGMSRNGNHIVNLNAVPLTFFYDNVGSFRVRTTIK
ncbi:hypothetical protein F7734_12630 [Scytonema sp. UIC 10036]|uniref:hypothetical protein n=1 Tax=Scytonema sp. UIC 10036 TaxID=2304196 RepID=UPI0012DA78CA|nr:hypothetical protein [Scytonema sp. UIC 10036]MUG93228.1 hypothetical protein [Scytonema sp. UIC 10036]